MPPRRFRRLFRLPVADPRRAREEMDDEIRFHLETRAALLMQRGLTRDAAMAEARRRFGAGDDTELEARRRALADSAAHREDRMRLRDRLDTLRHDLLYAIRGIRRAPGFAAAVILTLALGLGANTAIFSVVYSVLLRPLPYAHADRLLDLRERNGMDDRTGMVVASGNYATWLQEARSFEALGAYSGGPSLTLTGVGEPLSLRPTYASASYWRALYIPPALGRYFGPDEDRPGAPRVVVLSHALWESRFGGDPGVVGRTITLSDVPYTIVGVAAPEYALTPQAAQTGGVWVPLALGPSELADHSDHELSVVGLPRPGVSPELAVAELTRIETALARQYPHSYFDGGIVARPLRDTVVGPVRSILLMLFGAVSLVLLTACANVANLLLARAAARQKEIAIRSALGAGRLRIVRQSLVESAVLAVAGAAASLLVAAAGMRFLVETGPPWVPRLQDAALSLPVLGFTLAVALLCAAIFGLAPALTAARLDLRDVLSEGGRDTVATGRHRIRGALVIAQVSIALVLLVGAGLLLRSAIALQHVSPGFETRNTLIAGIALPIARYPSDTTVVATYAAMEREIAAVPGVRSVGLVSRIPIGAFGMDCVVRPEGEALTSERATDANIRSATPGFFDALGVPLLRGRVFTPADHAGTLPVVVINRSLAHWLFGDTDPIGRRIGTCVGAPASNPLWHTVVGVIGDVHAKGLDQNPAMEAYFPHAQDADRSMTLVVQGAVPVTTLLPALRHAVAVTDPLLPLAGVSTMTEVVARSLAVPRFTTLLLLLLGGTGLALTVIGIYGVIAYFVVQRTREIGMRIALGATTGRVVGLVVRRGLVLALAGVVVGLAASWALSRMLQSMLFHVGTHDPATLVAVGALLGLVAVAASAVPAWRAARVDPMVALRQP